MLNIHACSLCLLNCIGWFVADNNTNSVARWALGGNTYVLNVNDPTRYSFMFVCESNSPLHRVALMSCIIFTDSFDHYDFIFHCFPLF